MRRTPTDWGPEQEERQFLGVLDCFRGRGLVHTGSENWADLTLQAAIQPFLASEFGMAVRVQGLRRYYALLLSPDGQARLVRVIHGEETVLASADSPWESRDTLNLSLTAKGNRLTAQVGDGVRLEAEDPEAALAFGQRRPPGRRRPNQGPERLSVRKINTPNVLP